MVAIVFPHGDKVFRAKNEGFEKEVVRQNPRERSCHQCLPQADNIAEQHAAAFMDVVGRDLDGGGLKFKQLVSKVFGDAVLDDSFTRLLGKVVRHLDVDMVRRNGLLACPALLDDFRDFLGNIETPFVVPAFVKPFGEFLAGVVVHHIDVEFALFGESGERQVAAAEKGDGWVDRVGTMAKVELRVQGVAQE